MSLLENKINTYNKNVFFQSVFIIFEIYHQKFVIYRWWIVSEIKLTLRLKNSKNFKVPQNFDLTVELSS